MNSQQPSRNRGADQGSSRNRNVKARNCSTAITRGKPVCQVNNHPRKETRFCKSQEESRGVELSGCVHKASKNRDYSPRDHDPCNPFPRTPTFDDNGPRYLEQNIGQVKHAYAEAVYAIAKAQVGAHSEISEGNVNAIDEIHNVDQEHERKQPARNSATCS